MAIDFPASPTNGQTFTSGSVTYTWDGTKWTAVAAGGSTNSISQGNTNATVTDTGSDGRFVVTTEGSERLRVDSSGRLLAGYTSTTSVAGFNAALQLQGTSFDTATAALTSVASNNNGAYLLLGKARGGTLGGYGIINAGDTFGQIRFLGADGAKYVEAGRVEVSSAGSPGTDNMPSYMAFYTNGGSPSITERARIDSSGRLLVGTTNPLGEFAFQASNSSKIDLVVSNAASFTAGTDQESRVVLGKTEYNAVTPMGVISARPADPTSGANGVLTFSTRGNGTVAERMRITSIGDVYINKTSPARSIVGAQFESSASYTILGLTSTSQRCIDINRLTTDGNLIEFYQDSTQEGSISVSGTTVSYNGAHLSRWSQLPSGVERTEILRGTVLSNIDEMCEWGEEHNEQLNRMKVSDVEGDKNVSGVFQAWDDDDDTYINDFYCAMTGDFIIRIGAGVTVERGDLLMSAGDGTAKPQDDDIIRSKTIAKVTSTNVSCTYEDGSYCVPCVLMAC